MKGQTWRSFELHRINLLHDLVLWRLNFELKLSWAMAIQYCTFLAALRRLYVSRLNNSGSRLYRPVNPLTTRKMVYRSIVFCKSLPWRKRTLQSNLESITGIKRQARIDSESQPNCKSKCSLSKQKVTTMLLHVCTTADLSASNLIKKPTKMWWKNFPVIVLAKTPCHTPKGSYLTFYHWHPDE